jgi:hypothetical protein
LGDLSYQATFPRQASHDCNLLMSYSHLNGPSGPGFDAASQDDRWERASQQPYKRKPLPAGANIDLAKVSPAKSRISSSNDEAGYDDPSHDAQKQPFTSASEQPILPHENVPYADIVRRRYMTGRKFEIGLAFLLTTLPIAGLTVALMCLIWENRLVDSPSSDGGSQAAGTCPSGLYVNYSATRLTFVSSLISTVAAYMSVPLMTLISFPIARKLMRDSTKETPTRLPSPYQLHLLVSSLSAGLSSLWKTIQYMIGWRSRRARLHSTIWISFSALLSIVTLR